MNCPSKDKTPILQGNCITDEDYKTQARIFHPDKNKGCTKDATIKFQKLANLCKKGGHLKKTGRKIKSKNKSKAKSKKRKTKRKTTK